MKLFSKRSTSIKQEKPQEKRQKPAYRKLIEVPIKSYQDIQTGDRITLTTASMIISGLTVEGSNRLYVSRSSRTNESKVYLDQLEERGESVEKVLRYIDVESTYTPKDEEIDHDRIGVVPGSRASLEQAVEAVDCITNYFENRMQLGDPLFDQWMVDALNSSREASKNIQKTINVLHPTD